MDNSTHTSTYSASFTAGSLLHRETTSILHLLEAENTQELLKSEAKNNQYIQINSEKSRKRVIAEINKRYAVVKPDFWEYYKTRNVKEQKAMLFYICLRCYKLMFDFHFNVTVKKWLSSTQSVEPFLYRMELSEISGRHQNVNNWSQNTKDKTISVYLRVLKDIGMLNGKTMELKPLLLTDELMQFFAGRNEFWFFDACLLPPHIKNSFTS
ncbi:MAG TPA: DUF1819 family protein [Bacteroidales bacterium]|nr:DUF1819 family protein [Bacteroidales bacterium]